MKNTTRHLISLACFLLVSLTAAQAPPRAPILDTSGQELLTGAQYYIRSPFWGAGEGDVNVDNNSSCPLDLVLASRTLAGPGLPVAFHLPHESESGRPIRTFTDVSIQFSTASADTACNDGGVWTVRFQALLRGFGVTTGGSLGAVDSLFTIEPAEIFHRISSDLWWPVDREQQAALGISAGGATGAVQISQLAGTRESSWGCDVYIHVSDDVAQAIKFDCHVIFPIGHVSGTLPEVSNEI
ncbi:Kunitz trypsin inhibitor [Striga asiatica]|uniref:Kunitz trypsin inhibitor n=1 Tax=Striga asiatica TaxID=4170 RepID=A0A5A7PY49_STRAF|nr:Kunitz trypsin inhibitor [Striga asiatica]